MYSTTKFSCRKLGELDDMNNQNDSLNFDIDKNVCDELIELRFRVLNVPR